MSLDVTEAIALAKDLLQTSSDFQEHDPELAEQFAGRAFEICDDLGIDRKLIGAAPAKTKDRPRRKKTKAKLTPVESKPVEPRAADVDDDGGQAGDQLRALLQQQARVLENARDIDTVNEQPKAARGGSFWPFGRTAAQGVSALQSA